MSNTQKKSFHTNPLNNWKLWMKKRKEIHTQFQQKLERKPENLLINFGDELRLVNEEKALFEYRNIETKFDKYGGNPTFWKLPVSLKNKLPPATMYCAGGYRSGAKRGGGSEYFAAKNYAEKNEIPVIEYIAVPDVVLGEKDLLPRTRNVYNVWKKNKYRQKIIENESIKLKEIEPHKPDLSSLVVVGTKINKPLTSYSSHRSDIEISNSKSESNSPEMSFSSPEEKLSQIRKLNKQKIKLKINDIECFENLVEEDDTDDDDDNDNIKEIVIVFEYFNNSTKRMKQLIKFENAGQVVLHLSWEKNDDYKQTNRFCFLKNDFRMLPKEKCDFPVWFYEKQYGIYLEKWQLNIMPFSLKIILVFKLLVHDMYFAERVKKSLETFMQDIIIQNLIDDVIMEMIDKSTIRDNRNHHVENLIVTNKDLFYSHNLIELNGHFLSKFDYNREAIRKLEEFYRNIRFDSDPDEWNLSIDTLMKMARKKDLLSYFVNSCMMYGKREQMRKENERKVDKQIVKMPGKQDGKKLDEQNKKNGQLSDTLEANPICKEHFSYYNELNQLIEQNLHRKQIEENNDERRKYLTSYTILRTFLIKIINSLMAFDKKKSKEIEKINQCLYYCSLSEFPPDRLKYEIFDESFVPFKNRRCNHDDNMLDAKPKSNLLKNGSWTDLKKINRIYFNKEMAAQKKDKKLVGKEDKSSSKKSDKSKTKEKTTKIEQKENESLPNFNPFRLTFPTAPPLKFLAGEKVKPSYYKFPTMTTSTFSKIENYETKYLIVYTNLCTAVDVLAETLEILHRTNQHASPVLIRDLLKHQKINVPDRTDLDLFDEVEAEFALNFKENSFNNVEQERYRQYLLDNHWKNNNNIKEFYL